ncbi:hydrogenase nickel incorporation protein HypB [Candidatus Albibeggiatoa sp. nov. BB20]|uniref:hydrogenase nickel incorporation protein HypB n=1 Tax=Candidatus Albibeggiatoa sp. nov. BB20 TaxID=3162723 RepID=UPI003365406A
MCDTCGCNITPGNQHLVENDGKHATTEDGKSAIIVLKNLLSENDHQAIHNRQHFDKHGVLAINLMSSPGSGKTALLETTILALKSEFNIAVIEGDLETENDAQRIRKTGVPAIQIVTGTACHLDAHLVHKAVHQLDLANLDIIFIENVGNLVCPASFDLGHHRNVTLLSVTEGDDKPAKYPVMFRTADVMLLSKIDLLPYLDDFSPQRAIHYMQHLANPAPVLQVSAKTQQGLDAWLDWLRQEIAAEKQIQTETHTAASHSHHHQAAA